MRTVGSAATLAATLLLAPPIVAEETVPTMRVLTFNVWHGLRSGEGNRRFPGEEIERGQRRFAWQVQEIQRLDPDVLFLQEVNPNQKQARKYAAALGYHEIHKVTSCGLHLGFLYKIPRNVNDGLTILAKPDLRLRRLASMRLSGNARCSASWGLQTKESRYALIGEVSVGGQRVLVATTHLSSPPFVPVDFVAALDRLVDDAVLSPDQRDEILSARHDQDSRNLREVRTLLRLIERWRNRSSGGRQRTPVVVGGDFNVEPESPGIALLLAAGYLRVGEGAVIPTWDPVANDTNYMIGAKRAAPLPTFGKREVEELLAHRRTTPRQIDHLFVSGDLAPRSIERVLDRHLDGIYPSDHYGLLATVALH